MIEPLGDYVLLIVPDKSKTEAGIILTESAQEEVPNIVEVAIPSPTNYFKLKPREKVFIKQYGWEKFSEGDVNYLLGKEENIIGRIK